MREEDSAGNKTTGHKEAESTNNPFGVEIGRKYRSGTTPQGEVLKVEAILDEEMVFREMDSEGKPISVYSEEDWQPSRWEAL